MPVLFFLCLLISSSIYSYPVGDRISSKNGPNQDYRELFRQAEKLQSEGEFDKAIEIYEKSLPFSRGFGDKRAELDSLLKLGLLNFVIGEPEKSTANYADAIKLAEELNLKVQLNESQTALEINKLYTKGRKFRSSEEYQKSIESFQTAIKLAKKISSLYHEGKCLRQLSINYWTLNNIQKFYSLNEEALIIAQNLNNPIEVGNCLNNIGLFYWKNDNYPKALDNYERSLEIAKRVRNLRNETQCLNNIGLIYKELGDYDKALEYFARSISIDKQLKDESYILIDLNNIGTTFRKKGLASEDKGDFSKALTHFKNCLKILEKSKNKKAEIEVLNNIGTVYSDLRNHSQALDYFKIAQKKAEENGDTEAISTISNNLGIVYSDLGNYEESTKCYQRAIDLALKIRGGQILWEAYLENANNFKKQGKYQEALQNYRKSIAIIEDIRSTINLEDYKASYLGGDKRIEAYQNIIDLLVKLKRSHLDKSYDAQGFNFLERAKARAFLDSLEVSAVDVAQGVDFRLANQEKELMRDISKLYTKLLSPELTSQQRNSIEEQIQSYEEKIEALKNEIRTKSPAYANLKYPETITVAEAQKELLDDRTACIAYMVGKENSYGFALTKNDLKIFTIPSQKDIQTNVTAYLKALTDVENDNFRLGFELFQELVLPGLGEQIQKVIFVPDDILHFLPFEALVTSPEKKSWLIQQCDISYAPSLSSLREIALRKSLNKLRPREDILEVGDPDFGASETEEAGSQTDIFKNFYSSSAFKFYRLRYSGLEIQKIAALFKPGKRSVLVRENATEDEFKKTNLSDYKILHFATHGLIDDKRPARSAIVLSLGHSLSEDGFLQAREIFNLKLHSDLVTLSACQTGLGQFIRGEGIENLSRAFFYAGASSVLMSLWAINDQASYQLMERFYLHLRSATTIGHALRRAKLEMIDSGTLSHPYYWAGFIVTGKADTVIFPRRINNWVLAIAFLFVGGTIFMTVKTRGRKRS